MVNFPFILDLSKVKDWHMLLFSLPYLILNFFGSGYLLLWTINDFNYLNFAAGWLFTISYVGSLFITARHGSSLISFGLKSVFLSNFVMFYIGFSIYAAIKIFIKRIKK